MKTNSGKRRFWAAVLCVVAVLAMTVGGLDAPKMRSVYAKQQADGVTVTSVPAGQTIGIGENIVLTAATTVSNINVSNDDYVWSKAEGGSGDVSGLPASGKNVTLTGTKAGQVTVNVTSSNHSYSKTITITVNAPAVPVDGVKLDASKITLKVNASANLTATIEPQNATNKKISWKSADETVAVVDNTGKVTGKKAGITQIIVTTEDGNEQAVCDVTVTEGDAGGTGTAELRVSAPSAIPVGVPFQLRATVTPEDKSVYFNWKSDDEKIAAVTNKGVVMGVKEGTTTIHVTAYKTENGKNVEIGKESVTITVSKSQPVITKTTPLNHGKLGIAYEDVITATGQNLKWNVTGLPAGLEWKENGTNVTISGTPKEKGTFTVTATVTNTTTNEMDSRQYELTVSEISEKVSESQNFTSSGGSVFTGATITNLISHGEAFEKMLLAYKPNDNSQYHFAAQIKTMSTGKNQTETTALQNEIKRFFGGLKKAPVIQWLAVDIEQHVKAANEAEFKSAGAVDETVAVMEIELNAGTAVTGIDNLYMFRYHKGTHPRMTRLESRPKSADKYEDGTFYVDEKSGIIYVYTRLFSTYAAAYPQTDNATYLVKYSVNGGKGSVPDAVVVEEGEKIPEDKDTKPTKDGSTFGGWAESATATKAWDFDTALKKSDTANGGKTLYAMWTSGSGSGGSSSTGSSGTGSAGTGGTGSGGSSGSGLSQVDSPQTGDPMDLLRVLAALLVIGMGIYVVTGLKAGRK